MSDNWNTYFTFIDDKPASILLDLEPWKNGEEDHSVHLFQLKILLNEPNENGLTCDHEAKALFSIEDSINDGLNDTYMFVGRMTSNGSRDFYYYTESEDGSALERIAATCIQQHQYSVNWLEEETPRAFYTEVLYPNKREWHRMMNRELVDKLVELGDHLETSRTVNHWIYFNSIESRDLFKQSVQKNGFHVEDELIQDSKYMLNVSRKDIVEVHSISEVTDILVDAAQKYHGEYDGWETKVIQKPEGLSSIFKNIFKRKK